MERSNHVIFPIVGIGASAGGLDAFKTFFTAMPADSGMAFVLIQHLDPTHESLTADLLARHTAMQVAEIHDRMRIEVNHIHVIPPNKYVSVRDGFLHLSEPVLRRGMRMPIDYFFRSLAEAQQEKAIGIILSGTGTDGTLGLKAIKGEGGVALAQSPGTAQYDGMPRSAVTTGLVDHVAPIESMPEILMQYVEHAFFKRGREPAELAQEEPDRLRSILAVLRTRTKYDFSCYKKGTLMRRIGRRMGLNHIEELDEYLNFLREHSGEPKQLFKDLLIGVTAFFREPEAFETLEKVIEEIVRGKGPDSPIRIWVPGCATGEEPYSIAMLFAERLQIAQKNCTLQLFATDIDEEALSVARAGLYPENIAVDLSPERLRRFLKKEDGSFRVTKPIRNAVVYAVQNLIADPPFSKLDLICCRNLLIYLEPNVQKKVIALFHFALNENGHLFLGGAETIGQQDDLFVTVSKKWRLYRRIGALRRDVAEFPIFPDRQIPGQLMAREQPLLTDPGRLGEFTRELLIENFAPAAVLISRKNQVLYYYGPTELYLDQPTGAPTDDLLVRAREGLRTKLRALLHKTAQGDGKSASGVVRLRRDEETQRVKIIVNPIKAQRDAEGLLLVSFRDEAELAPPIGADDVARSDESTVQQLEYELRAARDDLQSTTEEMETSSEELKAANEEVMSVNEELQSTNEELETSKEELQSLNEELTTVNTQLEEKVGELEKLNDDLSNLLSSTDIATIFLDTDFRIKRFTPTTTQLFNLIATDIGRPISDIAQRSTNKDLLTDARTVLDKLTTIEREVRTDADHWYCRRIFPYRTEDNRIAGVVVTHVDISERKKVTDRFRLVVEANPNASVVVNRDGEIVLVNARTEESFGYARSELIGHPVEMLVPERFRAQHRTHRRGFFASPEARLIRERELFGRCKDGSEFPVEIGLNPIETEQGTLVVSTLVDITERKRAEQVSQAAKDEAEHANQAKTRFLAATSHDLRQPLQALKLLTSVLVKKIKDPEALEIIEHQVQALASMGNLLTALLDLSKVETGTIEPKISEFTVGDMLGRMQGEFELQAGEKGLGFRMVPCSMSIRSDPALLERILQNLIANAVKYTDAGKVLIGCRRRGGRLRIEVWDTGAGIPGDQLTAIFDEFTQLDNPARDKRKGLGLGLSVVKHLTRILEHELDVQSKLGKGSMFCVEVPVGTGSDSSSPDSLAADTLAFKGRAGALVLLVEDNPAVLDATRLLLETLGWRVITATSGSQAVARLEGGAVQPDFVIADQRLPGGETGIEVIRHIREASGQEIPAVLITGDTSQQAVRDMKASGGEVLFKPTGSDELVAIMNQLMKTRH